MNDIDIAKIPNPHEFPPSLIMKRAEDLRIYMCQFGDIYKGHDIARDFDYLHSCADMYAGGRPQPWHETHIIDRFARWRHCESINWQDYLSKLNS